MANINSPCAACKYFRRKCTLECVFFPYFPPDQPQKFSNVHKVFGASNVAKILNGLSPLQRGDVINSLVYEAETRLRDPIYGCVGFIEDLQHTLRKVQTDILEARKKLATYTGTSTMNPMLETSTALPSGNDPPPPPMGYNWGLMMGLPSFVGSSGIGPSQGGGGDPFVIRDAQPLQQHHHHLTHQQHYNFSQYHQPELEPRQQITTMVARDQHETIRNQLREVQRQQQELVVRFSNGFDVEDASCNASGSGDTSH